MSQTRPKLARKSYKPDAEGPLDGVRVLDLSRLVAGNTLTQVLGDFGAEVIKVEPPAGDTLRDWQTAGVATNWKLYARNKKSLCLDLRKSEARELLLRLNSIMRRAAAPATAARSVKFGAFAFDVTRSDLLENGKPVPLTSGEAALLKVLARNPGATISRAALAEQTGGGEGRAVDVQITRLRRKIERDPKNPRHLQTIWGEGYVLWTD